MPKVLVVDDHATMVRLLTMTLPSEYTVSQATNGQEAVEMAEKVAPDLMLLDVNMPGLNGFEVLRKVREIKSLANTKVIMVTARTDESDRNLARQLGADAYLTKPFSPLALLEEVSKLLSKS
ncbi:MAG: response regulator [Chloroflexi bacterium]|nr:response regulator [Chloroflexota bacterium]